MKNFYCTIKKIDIITYFKKWNNSSGLTVPELLIVVGILAILISISTLSLGNIQKKTQLTSTLSTLIADIQNQQMRAMSGETGGASNQSDYGVYFETNQYTLFQGSTYTPSNTTNFTISIDSNEFDASSFSNSQIIFAKGSGQIVSFASGSATLVVSSGDATEQRTIDFNELGVITGIN